MKIKQYYNSNKRTAKEKSRKGGFHGYFDHCSGSAVRMGDLCGRQEAEQERGEWRRRIRE